MTLFGRGTPRAPVPWPYDLGRETPIVALLVGALGSVVVVVAATLYQGSLYERAGAGGVAEAGAFAGLAFVALVMVAAAALYRRGRPAPAVVLVAVLALLGAAVLAALPPAAARSNWLTSTLSILVGLLPTVVLAVWVTLAARHLPLRWSGWRPSGGRPPAAPSLQSSPPQSPSSAPLPRGAASRLPGEGTPARAAYPVGGTPAGGQVPESQTGEHQR